MESHGVFSYVRDVLQRSGRNTLTWLDVQQTLTITYASEVCPVALRGYLTCYVNFCWGLGQVIGIGVIKSMLGRTDQWAYRIPYAIQCAISSLHARTTR